MKRFRLVFWFGIVSVLSVLAVYAFIPDPIGVDTLKLSSGPMSVEVSAEGRSRVREHFLVSAPVDGWLERIGNRAGETVHRGEVIARIYPARARLLDPRSKAEADAAVSSAGAAVSFAIAVQREAEATAAEAGREADRVRRLYERQVVSVSRLDQAVLAKQQADARLSAALAARLQAQASLEAAESRLNPPDIKYSQGSVEELMAPADGTILRVHVPSEGLVTATTPLLEIADLGNLEIIADFLSQDAALFQPGARVRISQWGGEDLAGTVRRVEPSAFTKFSALGVEQQRVGVIIDLQNPRQAGFGDGYRVRASVTVWSGGDVIRVPASALFRDGPVWKAFTVNRGRARSVVVTPGWRNALDVQVVSGLVPGDQVILYPPDNLTEGMRVRSRKTAPAP